MATRTAAAVVVWNGSHDGAQDRRAGFDGWHNPETERQGSEWGDADDVMISVMTVCILLKKNKYFCNPAYFKKVIQPPQPNNLICVIVLQH